MMQSSLLAVWKNAGETLQEEKGLKWSGEGATWVWIENAGNTADGSGNHGRSASQARITGKNWGLPAMSFYSFPEIRYP